MTKPDYIVDVLTFSDAKHGGKLRAYVYVDTRNSGLAYFESYEDGQYQGLDDGDLTAMLAKAVRFLKKHGATASDLRR